MSDTQLVSFDIPTGSERQNGAFSLKEAQIVVDQDDYVGISIAANNLAQDFGHVFDRTPSPVLEHHVDASWFHGETAIIVGTLTSSHIIKSLADAGQLQLGGLRDKWESFHVAVVEYPTCLSGCRKAMVVAGSDKRGAIFGIYTLSEQIGVSP